MTKHLKINLQSTLAKKVESIGFIHKKMFLTWVRLLVWSLQVSKQPYMVFASRILKLWTINGSTFVVMYLKECSRVLTAYISGNPVFTSQSLPVSIAGGLPRVIPGPLRTLIRSKDLLTIRATLSVFAVYRIIKIPGKAKLETITDSFTGLSESLPFYEVKRAVTELWGKPLRLKPVALRLLSTAGPNSQISMWGIWKDILAWKNSPIYQYLETYCFGVPGGREFLSLLDQEYDRIKDMKLSEKPLILGSLSEKLEAAGKVRIFAITDSITQSVFQPLSDGIFEILRTLPMDGTFDQNRPVQHLKDLHLNRTSNDQRFYSYDLSAATDRLPLNLQQQVLGTMFDDLEIPLCWGKILTERDWYYKGKPLRYSVGQPMGALSSWAMLALTHHTIVRIAAFRAGLLNFQSYAILGDDVVIYDNTVAKVYHSLMTEVLGVEINLSKSMISYNSFEFAKRIVTMEGEVSAVGPKNLLVGLVTLKGIPSILLDLANKGLYLNEETVTAMYKRIPTVRKSQLERLSWLVKGPFGFVPTEEGLSSDIKLGNTRFLVDLKVFLYLVEKAVFITNSLTWIRNVRKMDELLSSLKELEFIPGSDIETSGSLIYDEILKQYSQKAEALVLSKPIRWRRENRFDFDWSWDHNTRLRHWMKYINEQISAMSDSSIQTPFDPFSEVRILSPLSFSKKSDNFWQLVADLEWDRTDPSLRSPSLFEPGRSSNYFGTLEQSPLHEYMFMRQVPKEEVRSRGKPLRKTF